MRSAADILRDEHQVILRALLTLESAAGRPGTGGAPSEGVPSCLDLARDALARLG
jgi:hypothetical protein